MTTPAPQTYYGSCHCGLQYFELSTLHDITAAWECPCLHCTKKGYLWLRTDDVLQHSFGTKAEGSLLSYESETLVDKFCSRCSTPMFGTHKNGPLKNILVVNVRAVHELDPYKLRVDHVEYDPVPIHESRTKPVFSCLCRRLSAVLMSSTDALEIKEDNCSFCVRTAFIGIYPTKELVRIQGWPEHGTEYRAEGKGRGFTAAVSCSTCGVHLLTHVYGPPISVFDKLPPSRREVVLARYYENINLLPLNMRALDGVNISKLVVNRQDVGTDGYPLI